VKAELLLDARAELGEGPAWDLSEGLLVWVDIAQHLVHLYEPVSATDEAIEVGQPVGAAVPRASGGLVLAMRDGFAALDLVDHSITPIAEVEAEVPSNRMNDGKCDPIGRFWAGTMSMALEPGAGALYRLDPGGGVARVLENVTISNGLDWTEGDTSMYYIDSPTQRVDVFDFDLAIGSITNRRTAFEIDPGIGMPDGMTLDAEGGLWVALWGGGAVHRYDVDGKLDAVVELPVSQVTSCAFGGDSLDRLFITSARTELGEAELADQPLAGGLFCSDPGIKGRPANRFSG
jgi:sugar lactone lactonase YvrE